MPGSAAKVVISDRQQSVLQQLSTARTVAQYLVVRASIILLAFQGLSNQAIAARVGLGRHQVGIWRCRWQEAFADLIRVECTDEPPALRHAIDCGRCASAGPSLDFDVDEADEAIGIGHEALHLGAVGGEQLPVPQR